MNAGVPLGAPASLYLMLYALKKESSTPNVPLDHRDAA